LHDQGENLQMSALTRSHSDFLRVAVNLKPDDRKCVVTFRDPAALTFAVIRLRHCYGINGEYCQLPDWATRQSGLHPGGSRKLNQRPRAALTFREMSRSWSLDIARLFELCGAEPGFRWSGSFKRE
jgi:hypothetical protein